MLVRKTLRVNHNYGKNKRFTRKNRKEQSGRGDGDEDASEGRGGGIVELFSLPFSLGGKTSDDTTTEPIKNPMEEPTDDLTEEIAPEIIPEPVDETSEDATEGLTEDGTEDATEDATEDVTEDATEGVTEDATEEEEPKKVSNVSGIQKAFEGYYGVEAGDVGNVPSDIEHVSMHKDTIEENDDGELVFKKDFPSDTDIAVLYRASIGFKHGMERLPVCDILEGNNYPDSPPNVVVDMTKLPVEVEDRKGVYVKVFSLVLKTTEEVLKGTRVNLAYVPSFVENTSSRVESTKDEKVSVPIPEQSLSDEDTDDEDLRMVSDIIEEDELLEEISTPPQPVLERV